MPCKTIHNLRILFSMAPMPTNRYDHSCGLVTHPVFGPEIVVAGGYSYPNGYSDTVDIYTINEDSWREGNILICRVRISNLGWSFLASKVLSDTPYLNSWWIN